MKHTLFSKTIPLQCCTVSLQANRWQKEHSHIFLEMNDSTCSSMSIQWMRLDRHITQSVNSPRGSLRLKKKSCTQQCLTIPEKHWCSAGGHSVGMRYRYSRLKGYVAAPTQRDALDRSGSPQTTHRYTWKRHGGFFFLLNLKTWEKYVKIRFKFVFVFCFKRIKRVVDIRHLTLLRVLLLPFVVDAETWQPGNGVPLLQLL